MNLDLTVGALGHCVSIPCKLSFTTELAEDVDPEPEKPIRVLRHSEQVFHAFVSTGDDEQVFEWTQIDCRMLPQVAFARLDDQVSELAVMLEGGRPNRRP